MKRYHILLILVFYILMLLLVGCKNRQVTSLIDTSESKDTRTTRESLLDNVEVLDVTPTIPNEIELIPPATMPPTEMDEVPNDTIPESSDEGTDSFNDAEPTSEEPKEVPTTPIIIVAESEGIDAVDDRAILLNDLDALLDSVLTSLDALENQTLTEDVTDLGGD